MTPSVVIILCLVCFIVVMELDTKKGTGGELVELTKTFRFEASHQLPRHKGKCARAHGHSWVLTVCVDGVVDPIQGFVMDYGDISEVVKPVIDQFLDHYNLNDLLENPTSENLIVWIGRKLYESLNWYYIELNETCTSSCRLYMEEYLELQR